MEEKVYSKEILSLLSIEGFAEEWVRALNRHKTYTDAYEEIEEKHIKYFGKRKYKNYGVFRNMYARKIAT